MTNTNINSSQLLPVVETAASSCCSSKPSSAAPTTTKEIPMSTQTFPVTGMTCGHCVGAVTQELEQIPGVSVVNIDLVRGGASSVTISTQTPLAGEQIADALDEAGNYQLATN
jgi:copper chaperone CopZ